MASKRKKKSKARGGWGKDNPKSFLGDWRKFAADVEKAEARIRATVERTVRVYTQKELETFAHARGVRVAGRE